MFNALGSIQGLINKEDLQGANMYLSDFAKLMRDSITNCNKEQITLNEEIMTLETYLKLEQLRFGFEYSINIHEIDVYITEIPSMLLQPLIENAVKHGVSTLNGNGLINLTFSKSDNDMIITLQDNGKGFVYSSQLSGLGLKLTKERIKLMNEMLKEQSIELQIKGDSLAGTNIRLMFKNWLL